MNITYTGIRGNAAWSKKNYVRLATICYNEEDNRDCLMAEYVTKVLKINGYDVPDVNVSGSFEIAIADKEEFEELKRVYSDAKKTAAAVAKFYPRQSRLYVQY